jgi:uncharacterized protein (TIGR04255 family)
VCLVRGGVRPHQSGQKTALSRIGRANDARDSFVQVYALKSPHPTYPKPTIVQVTSEIAFTSAEEVKLSAASLYPIFATEFPEIQPVNLALQLQVVLGQQQPIIQDPSVSANAQAFRFATPDGKRFVQLSKTNFVYQSNERYPGWKDFQAKLIELWTASLSHTKPSTIVKVGLRYINRIVKSKTDQVLSDWLQPTPDLPAALIASKEHFLGRIESSPAPSNLRLVTLANETSGPDWPHGAIILDIDRISTKEFTADRPKVLKNLEILHEDIWTSFDSAATKTLKQYLAGKRK